MGDESRLDDEEWLRRMYWQEGHSVPDIADQLGVTNSRVYHRFKKFGIERRSKSEAVKNEMPPELEDETYLERQYVENGKSCADIGEELDVSDDTVLRAVRKCEINPRDPSVGRRRALEKNRKQLPKAELRRLYEEKELPTEQIAECFSCSRKTVLRWVERYGIEKRSRAAGIRNAKSPEALRDGEWLREQYISKGKSSLAIAREVGCGSATVLSWLRRHGIEVRSLAESQPNKKNGRVQYGPGWNESKKEKVREKYDRRCAVCSRPEEECPTRLHVHHIVPARQFDDPDERNAVENLIPLCSTCHPKIEQMAPLLPVVARSAHLSESQTPH